MWRNRKIRKSVRKSLTYPPERSCHIRGDNDSGGQEAFMWIERAFDTQHSWGLGDTGIDEWQAGPEKLLRHWESRADIC